MLALAGSSGALQAQTLVANPTALTINAASNGTSQTANLALSISSGSSTFTIASASTCGCMATNPSSGTLSTTPQNILVIVNPTGIGAATYGGTVTITAPGATNSPVSVPVTINISAGGNSTIQVFPSALPAYNFASGAMVSSTQQLTVSSNNGSTTFTDAFTQTGGPVFSGNLVTLDVANGVASPNAVINVTANPAGLPDGTYTGFVTVAPGNGGSSVQVPVTVNIGSTTTVTANPASLTYNVTAGGVAQTTTVTLSNNTGSAVTFTPSAFTTSCGSGWLTSSPANQFTIQSASSAFLGVTVNPASFVNGTCQGSVTLTPLSGSPITIPVTVNVGSGTGTLGLAANPTAISISAPVGITPGTAGLQITTTSASPAAISAAATTSDGNNTWLSVSPTFVNSFSSSNPASLTVTANPSNLAAGTYHGTITIIGQQNNGGTLSIPVTFTVGGTVGSAPFTVTPTSLSIPVPTGSTTPVSQSLQVTTTSTSNVFVTATASTNGTGNWLTVNPPNLQSLNSTMPLTYTVSVSPSAFVGSGPFSGTITLTPQNGSTPVQIPVTVTVGSGTLKVTPSLLSFAYQTGTAFPAAQSLTVTSTGGAVTFSAQATTTSGGNWLVISPTTGSTGADGSPATITVSVNPSGLQPGITYNGNIAITGGSTTINVPVTLLVSNLPILALSSGQNTFNYQFQSNTLPPAQTVQVTSSGNPVNFTVAVDNSGSGGAFLTVTPTSGTTPQPLSLSLNPTQLATLAPGTYMTTVTLTAAGAGNSPVSFKVTLVVGQNNLLNASQGSLTFNYQIGQQTPPIQILNITSSGQPLVYSVTATSTNCGNFLSANPTSGTTPGSVGVGVTITALAPGTCTGVVHIASNSANVGNSPLDIPVTLYVSNNALLNVSPSAISVTTTAGSNPGAQTVALTSTDGTPLSFSVTSQTNDGIGWLLVGPTGGTTPTNITVGFNATGLPPKTYTGSITITSTGPANAPVVIPVTLTVTGSTTAAVTPVSLTFTQPFGGLAPASQTLQVTSSSGSLTFSSSASTFNGGNWLSVTGSGTTPGSVTVTANGSSLGQGTYNGFVTIVIPGAANSPLQVPVTLVVGPAQTVVLGASSLSFNYVAGSGNTPSPQTVSVTSSGGSVPFTATTSSNFLTVTPGAGNTPGSLSIGLNQAVLATLPAGPYTGTVVVSSPGLPSQTITVNLTVAAQPAPTIGAVVNGASLLAGAISPGEIITIFGTNLGPTPGQVFQLTSGGTVPTSLAGTSVTFDMVAAPLLYVSAGQINAIVPYEMAGRVSVSMVVTRNGVASAPLLLRMADTAPAIFSLTQTGSGQGAILNQNFTVNGASNPETKGRVISIFATGEGLLTPPVATGSVTGGTAPFPKPVATPVSVTIGGQPAQILYAGEAPTLVSGVLQVNAVVPTSLLGSGPFTVLLTVGANTSTQPITVAVQ
ncbi:MAG: hypothetical protein M3O35_14185 [Acidobacteriota bacterium]|nr:hypothetical protein [Acidobacteriota bacterium]